MGAGTMCQGDLRVEELMQELRLLAAAMANVRASQRALAERIQAVEQCREITGDDGDPHGRDGGVGWIKIDD